MKSILTSLILMILFALTVSGQSRKLSPKAEISLLSVTPGAELYSTFGHSALRVNDPLMRMDIVYNWGTFDFDTPGFYRKFLQGKLLYYLNPETFRSFEYGNMLEQRTITESILNLNPAEKQRLFDLINENLKKENRSYKYDFFYDNCATRIKDIVASTFGHQITWDSTLFKKEDKTMRQLLQPDMEDKAWSWFGMQLVLGVPTDKKASLEDFMFLPDHLHTIFKNTKNNKERPLIISEKTRPLTPFPIEKVKPNFWTSPLVILSLVALLGILSMRTPKFARWFDGLLWFALGILGLLFFLLWFATNHGPTEQNINLLWALPTHLFVFWRSRKTAWVDTYFIGAAILAALFLVFYNWLPHDVPVAAVPIVALIVVKGIWGRQKQIEIA